MVNGYPGDDLINDIATAVRKRYVEQVTYAGQILACQSNQIEATRELLAPYIAALNAANAHLWTLLREARKRGLMWKTVGPTPVAAFDPNKHCDARCWNANGYDCTCKCGAAFHGLGEQAVRNYFLEAA